VILICGGLADTVTELVCARLLECGYPYRLLDLGIYPVGFRICGHWQRPSLKGYLAGPDWKLDLEELTSAYVRFLGPEGRTEPPKIAPESAKALYFEYDSGLQLLIESLSCLVVNRLRGGFSNSSKPYQALLVRQCGLLTPPTLVTTDPEAARQFYYDHNRDVIYKSLSGIRSIVRRLQPHQLSRLSLLRHGPAQFQAYIPGDNVRVHTVGERVFAVRVRSGAVDYRYASREGLDVEMEPASLPQGIADACLRLARQLDLPLAGIDLKLTPAGEYYCFEVNPSPGFLYYEKYARQPISLALATLLHYGHSVPGDQTAQTTQPMRGTVTDPNQTAI
jgi:glutathione synthase/RimK-type ligase-like ATP-grasp enzyme